LFNGGANYKDLVRGAAREGYIVFAPLALQWPFGDRDRGTAIPADARNRLDAKLKQRGSSLRELEITKLRRAIDALLQARDREIDGKRIAMIGLSFGAAMTVHTMAAEPRIKTGVASCLPRMKTDLPAAWPSRALQVQMGLSDKLIPIEEPREVLAKGKPATLEYREFEGGHEFRGVLAWEFLRRSL
jgi:dienelactone hydrolase